MGATPTHSSGELLREEMQHGKESILEKMGIPALTATGESLAETSRRSEVFFYDMSSGFPHLYSGAAMPYSQMAPGGRGFGGE